MTNRRKNTRVEFAATVDLDFSGCNFTGCETSDLSLYGVFVSGVNNLKAGSECKLSLHLSGTSSDTVLRMKGEVVRVGGGGVGIKFLKIDLDSFYHLKNILYFNSGNPDMLEEEFQKQLASE